MPGADQGSDGQHGGHADVPRQRGRLAGAARPPGHPLIRGFWKVIEPYGIAAMSAVPPSTAPSPGSPSTPTSARCGFRSSGPPRCRDLASGWALVLYVVAFVFLIAMKSAVPHCAGLTVGLPFGVGLVLGLAMSAALPSANADLAALRVSAAATTLFMAACGTTGYATTRDLSGVARARSWAALLGISVLGVVLIFVNLPGAFWCARFSAW